MNLLKVATFGAGCFWGVESRFQRAHGVKGVRVGYMGGHLVRPSYQEVCMGISGHCEVVKIEYDPALVPFSRLLEIFWECHDPTQLNRQGVDVGEQYRSAIFYHDEEQREFADRSKNNLEVIGCFDGPIVTEVREATRFYPADDYHQHYMANIGTQSCEVG